ncbi:hypothetical protein [Pseudanabaena sp. PCC 6802]|nr:hypothetical protein [Pseudanabaena sp. PCC 6802]
MPSLIPLLHLSGNDLDYASAIASDLFWYSGFQIEKSSRSAKP